MIIQETHSSQESENVWENEWGGKAIYSHGSTAARGIAIFTTKEIYRNCSNIILSPEGRYIILDVKENDNIVTVAAIYAPK